MLIRYPDVDAHLDAVEDLDGHLFKISAREITSFQLKGILKKIEKKILENDDTDTLVFIEEPPHRWGRYLVRELQRTARKIDGRMNHRIHAFIIQSALYEAMIAEFTDWD